MIQRNQRVALTEIAQFILKYRSTLNAVAIKFDSKSVHNETVERIAMLLYNRVAQYLHNEVVQKSQFRRLGIKPYDLVEAPYIQYDYEGADGLYESIIEIVFYNGYSYVKVEFRLSTESGVIQAEWSKSGNGWHYTDVGKIDDVLSGNFGNIDTCFKDCSHGTSGYLDKFSGESNLEKMIHLIHNKIVGEDLDLAEESLFQLKRAVHEYKDGNSYEKVVYFSYAGLNDDRSFEISASKDRLKVRQFGAELELPTLLIKKYGNKFIDLAKQWFNEWTKWIDESHTADAKEGINEIREKALDRMQMIQSIPDSAFYNIGILEHKGFRLFFAEGGHMIACGIPLDTNNDPVMVDVVDNSTANGSRIPIYHDYIAVVYSLITKRVKPGICTKVGGYRSKLNGITEQDLRDALAIHDIKDADALVMHNK